MAPEALAKNDLGRPAGMPMDIWALGAIAYWLLTGKHPFGDQITAVASILKGAAPPPPDPQVMHGGSAGIAAAMWGIILDCMQAQPRARPTAEILAERCSNLLYINAPRLTVRLTGKDRNTPVWFGRSSDKNVAIHHNEFTVGAPSTNARVSCFAFDGAPNLRGISAIQLKVI